MNIDQQIQQLIEQAPQYGAMVEEIELVAPIFQVFANRLQHPQYYILQNLEQNWVFTTLQHRTQAELTKNVVYAYPSLEAVKTGVATLDPDIIALPVSVVQLLFQLLAMEPVDSIIFLDDNQPNRGAEVSRQDLRQAIAEHVQWVQQRGVPTDIA
jgi:hypothetical protein